MAFLNKQERDELLDEIKDKRFNQIRNICYRKDPQARLAYHRNVQMSGKWSTRYVLEGLGTQVTVVENIEQDQDSNDRIRRRKYKIESIIVEPTADNRL
jgi:hypothetical protein